MPHYFIPRHVHVCVSDQCTIFLNLRSNRYYGISRDDATALRNIVRNLPADSNLHHQSGDWKQRAVAVAARLANIGLLTAQSHGVLVAAPPAITRPVGVLVSDGGVRPELQVRHLLTFLYATATALYLLHFRSLERVVDRVERRKQRRAERNPLELEHAQAAVRVFLGLRPFGFTSKRKCLLDSLVLIEFLALHGIFPTWVIGVAVSPFRAHSWIEQNGIVFTDTIERVSNYTPIMAI